MGLFTMGLVDSALEAGGYGFAGRASIHSHAPACDPEFALLLACIGNSLGAPDSGRECSVSEAEIRWPRFLWLADRHQVIPLARASLLQLRDDVPESVRVLLDQRCRTITALNLSLSAELIELLALFRSSAIPAAPFKGPALAIALYGNIWQRQIADLDVFVPGHRFAEAAELLLGRGYEIEERARKLSREQLRVRFKDVLFTHPLTGVHLELHWSVAEPGFDRELSSMPVPDCTRTVQLLGEPVPMHAPEDLLLLLCVHGLRHRWESLKWVCDVACLLRTYPDLDWAAALGRARALSRERTLLLGVLLARDLTAMELPDSIESLFHADTTLEILAAQMREPHAAEATIPAGYTAEAVLGGAAFDAMRLRSREKKSDRVALFLRLMGEKVRPSVEDRQWISFPAYASALYWLVRPVRVLRHYGARCSLQLLRQLVHATYASEPKP